MGIKSLCAAAAVVVAGVSAADAATVVWKKKFDLTLDASVDCAGGWEDYVCSTEPRDFLGLPLDTLLKGVLTITEVPGDLRATMAVRGHGSFIYDDWVDFDGDKGTGFSGFPGYYWTTIEWSGNTGWFQHTYAEMPEIYDTMGEFTLAPVPLPASAALLPLGIGALAFLRKRRRSA